MNHVCSKYIHSYLNIVCAYVFRSLTQVQCTGGIWEECDNFAKAPHNNRDAVHIVAKQISALVSDALSELEEVIMISYSWNSLRGLLFELWVGTYILEKEVGKICRTILLAWFLCIAMLHISIGFHVNYERLSDRRVKINKPPTEIKLITFEVNSVGSF